MHKLAGSLVVSLMILGSSACLPTKVTGGGRIDRTATFGFNADSCDGDVQGRFTLVDPREGVRLRGVVTDALLCAVVACDVCGVGELQINAEYTSNNRSNPGSGELVACVDDDGEGQGATDHAHVEITSGPFDGYTVYGEVTGNVQEHACD